MKNVEMTVHGDILTNQVDLSTRRHSWFLLWAVVRTAAVGPPLAPSNTRAKPVFIRA